MLAAVVCALAATVGAAPAGAIEIVTEPGTGRSISNPSWWTVVQTGSQTNNNLQWPCMTAGIDTTQTGVEACTGTPDAVGSGVIQLVDVSHNQSGEDGMLISGPIKAADGLKLTFKHYAINTGYGASAASVALINGDVPVDTSYPQFYYGGYVNFHNVGSGYPAASLPNALAGVVMDSYGYASGSTLQTGCTGAPGNRANTVVLLGPGHTTTTGYCYIAGAAANATPWTAVSPRSNSMHSVEVDVSPTGDSNPRFVVKVDGTERINVPLSSLSPAGYVGATVNNISTYRFAFVSGNTGDGHFISNIQADSLSSTPPTLSVGVVGHDLAMLAPSYQTVTVSNQNSALAETTPVTVTASLPTGVVVHSTPTGSGWDCSATVTGSSSVSCTHSITLATLLMQGQSLPDLEVPLTLTAAATAGSTSITYTVTDSNSPASSNTGSETIQALLPGTPPVTVTKTAGSATYSASGQPRTFTYTVTNTSSATVTGITVTDSFAGASTPSCQATTLAAGASTTCTSSYTTTQSDVDTRRVLSGSATAGGVQSGSSFLSSASNVVAVTPDPTSSLSVSTTSSPTGFTAAGNGLTFTHTVTNTGATTLSSLAVSQSLSGASTPSCGATTLAPAASTTCTSTYTTTQADADAAAVVNIATATASNPQSTTVSVTGAQKTVTGTPASSLGLVTSSPTASFSAAGATVAYNYAVTNTGATTLTSIGVADNHVAGGGVSCPQSSLAPGASETCTASYHVTQSEVDAGSVTNSATALASNPKGTAVTSSASGATVTAAPSSSLSLTASSLASSYSTAGTVIGYRYLVTNTGQTTLHGVGVTDSRVTGANLSCPQTTLTPAASMTCTGTYQVTQSDVDSGSLSSSATAAGLNPGNSAVSSSVSSITVTASATPSLSLIVQAGPGGYTKTGDTLSYRYLLVNLSSVTVHGISIGDDHVTAGNLSCPQSTLAPLAFELCTGTYTTTAGDVTAGSVTNSATANGLSPANAAVASTPSSATVTMTPVAAVTIAASATSSGFTVAGQTLTYHYLVTNTGNGGLHNVGVTDDHVTAGNISCPQSTLTAGASETCTGTYTTTQADTDTGAVTTTSSASALDPTNAALSSVASTVTVSGTPSSTIALTMSSTSSGYAAAGDVLGYHYQVTNTGATTVRGVWVADGHVAGAGVSCPQTVLIPGASETCAASVTASQADVDAGAITSTATVAAVDPKGVALSAASSSVTVTATTSAALTLAMSSPSNGFHAAGDALGVVYLVHNTGSVTVHGLAVSDDHVTAGNLSCPATTLAPGASMACSGTYLVNQTDADAGGVTAVATAAGLKPGGAGVSSSSASVTVTGTPVSSLGLAVSSPTAGYGVTGDTVALRYLVTNTGSTTLHAIGVSHSLAAPDLSCPQSTLAPAASETCTATHAVTQGDVDAGSVTETATASATNPHSGAVSSAQSRVTVSASPASGLSISAASTSPPFQQAGDVLAYSYHVANTGATTLQGITVDDTRVAAADITCPQSQLVPGASETCTGTAVVTQSEVDAGAVSNTATATGTDPHGVTVSSGGSSVTVSGDLTTSMSLSATALTHRYTAAGDVLAFRYVITDTGATTLQGLTVGDDHVAPADVSCPTAMLAPGTSTTCTGTYTVTAADVDAGSVTATAAAAGSSIGGVDASSSAVQVSVTGAATASLSVVASSTSTGFAAAGNQLGYQYVVTNNGALSLHNLVVSDDHVAAQDLSCQGTTLAAGHSETCTGSYHVTQADVDASAVTSVATAAAVKPAGGTVSAAQSTVTVAGTPTSSLAVTASSQTVGFSAEGDPLAYHYLVTNTGATTIHGLAVASDLVAPADLSCPQSTLAPSASETCTGAAVVTQAAVDVGSTTTTARASGLNPRGATVSSAPSSVTVTGTPAPAVALTLTSLSPRFIAAGDTLAYRYLVSNTGTRTLHGITVSDDHVAALNLSCPAGTLAPGTAMTCTGTYTVAQSDIDAGALTSSAQATAFDPANTAVTSPVSTATVVGTATSAVTLAASAVSAGFTAAGDQLSYYYLVTNAGSSTLHGLAVSDDHVAGAQLHCPQTSLDAHDSMTCTGTYSTTQADVDAAAVTNTASVAGLDPQGAAVASAGSSVRITGTPVSALALTTSTTATGFAAAGEHIPYRYTVSNTGTVTLHGIGVSDDHQVGAGVSCPSSSLMPGASVDCTASYTVTQADVDAGSVAVSAKALGVDPRAGLVSSTPSGVTVTGTPTLSMALVATSLSPRFTAAGDVLARTYLVTNTGSGTLHGLSVTDDHAATVTCPQSTLAPGGAMVCTSASSVTQADVDAGSLTSTATASGLGSGGQSVSSAPSAVVVTGVAISALDVASSAITAGFSHAGDTVTYHYQVTNTGTATLHNVVVSDDLVAPGDMSCPSSSLAAGVSMGCNGTHTVTQQDVDTGSITASSTAAATTPGGGTVVSPSSSVTVIGTGSSRLTVTPTAIAGQGFTHAGAVVSYRIAVQNAGSTTLRSVWVNASHLPSQSIECPNSTLATGAVMTCTAEYAVTQADVDERSVTTTAVAAGVNALNQPVTSPSGVVTVQGAPVPAVRLQATTTATRLAPAGGKLAFRYTVSNTGDTTVRTVRIGIATKHFGKISCPAQALTPGQSLTCTGSHTVSKGEWAAKRLAVAIRAVVDDPQGHTISSPTVRIMFTRNGVTK